MIKKRGSRKAQITMFVILGLVIIIVLAIIYVAFIRKPAVKEEFKEQAVPEEFKPLQNYIQNCIYQSGLEAIKKMGSHGGYIDPLNLSVTPSQLTYDSGSPTLSELVSLTGEQEDLVPYYLHVYGRASRSNYLFNSVAPSLENMEYQLSEYVRLNLPACINDFNELEGERYSVFKNDSSIEVTTKILEDSVEFYVYYEVEAVKPDIKTEMTDFKSVIIFPFKEYYDLALDFMNVEYMTQFLESFTISLINYYSGLNYNTLPPMIDYSNLPYLITWSNSKTELDFNGLLQSYVSALQVNGTKGYTPIHVSGTDLESKFYKSLLLDVFENATPNLSISFFYPQDSVYVKILPSRGDLISPNVEVIDMSRHVPARQFNMYKFFYDVSYPVIIEIRGYDKTKIIPEYSFIFALETNLIGNKGALAWNLGLGSADWNPSYLNITVTNPMGSMSPSTTYTNDTPLPPPTSFTLVPNLFCKQETWLTGDISLRTDDRDTRQPLEGVSIYYGCGFYGECLVGFTNLSANRMEAVWKGKLPICQGGYLTLAKEGYGAKSIKLSTQEGMTKIIATQKLDKIRTINATVKKMQIQRNIVRESNWSWSSTLTGIGSLESLNAEEQVILYINQKGFEAGKRQISNTVLFGKDGADKKEIKLVPGEYEITANLIDYNGFVIPANCSRVCSDRGILGIGCTEYTYYPDPEVNMTPAPWGGVELKQQGAGLFEITASDLDSNKDIEFHVIKLPDLSLSSPSGGCIDNLDEMGKIQEYSETYKQELWPVFK